MNTALIVIDGVLRKTMGGQPIPEGIRLYRSLVMTGEVVLLADDTEPARTLDWLDLAGLVKHAFVQWPWVPRANLADRANELRRDGYGVDLVVTPSPADVMILMEAGLNTLLFTHAQYAHPEWRPDTTKGVRPWYDITTQVATAARLKAADERLAGES